MEDGVKDVHPVYPHIRSLVTVPVDTPRMKGWWGAWAICLRVDMHLSWSWAFGGSVFPLRNLPFG